MLDTINDVITALNKVAKRFYSFPDFYFHDDEVVGGENLKHLELRFMHEFSNQFSRIFEKQSTYQKLEYDFEVPKRFMWSDKANISIRKTYERLDRKFHSKVNMHEYFTTIPDFLVHAGQHDKQAENQKLIIEAKLNPNAPKGEVFKDIFHTFIYSNEYKFQCSIMLLVNLDKERWIKLLSEYIDENYYSGTLESTKRIFVIFKRSYDAEAECYSIYNLLENPTCPKCNDKMVLRTAKQGVNSGNQFWGCSTYPKCNGTRSLT